MRSDQQAFLYSDESTGSKIEDCTPGRRRVIISGRSGPGGLVPTLTDWCFAEQRPKVRSWFGDPSGLALDVGNSYCG